MSLSAQPQSSTNVLARAALNNTEVAIGDQVELKINISAPSGTEIKAGGWRSSNDFDDTNAETGLPASLEIISNTALNVVAESPELLLEQWYTFQIFDTGYVFVPALAFPFKSADGQKIDTAFTEPLLLTVRGVPLNDKSELMPIKPIIEEGLNWLDFWPLYLGLFLVIGGFLIWRYLKHQASKKTVPPPPPPKPAHVLALEALTELESKQLWQNAQTKTYYSQLSLILRKYLEGRFGIPALESTTKQITHALKAKIDFDPQQSSELGELLQLSDLVKFARAEPAANLHQRGLERVRQFVKNTVPAPIISPDESEEE